jgi:hypothetical protein
MEWPLYDFFFPPLSITMKADSNGRLYIPLQRIAIQKTVTGSRKGRGWLITSKESV